MRLIAIVLASATLAASQSAPASKAGSTSTRPAKQYTMEQFLDTTSISGRVVLGRRIAHPVLLEQDRHLERLHHPGRRRRVDAGDEVDEGLDLRRLVLPAPTTAMLITRDQGGNELNHLYVLAEDGAERDLTPGDKLKAQFARLDARRHGLLRRLRTSAIRSSSTSTATTPRPTRARCSSRTRTATSPPAISDDAKWVALAKVNTTNDSDIYLWNAVDEGDQAHLEAHRQRELPARVVRSARRSISTS